MKDSDVVRSFIFKKMSKNFRIICGENTKCAFSSDVILDAFYELKLINKAFLFIQEKTFFVNRITVHNLNLKVG